MDYSHLHTYAPPQHVPENTGYTYALSSSYSSAALDFENLHKLDPVFDSPRMSRRSLRLTTTSFPDDRHNESIASNISYSGGVSDRSLSRSFRQQHNTSRQSSSSHHRSASLKAASNTSLQSSFSSHLSDASMLSNMLDESSIREQTEVNNLWGLDDDDPKAGDTTVIQANGDVLSAETQTTLINGYTCSDCSMLSDRSNVLTAFSATRSPASSTYTTSNKVYTQNRSQKHKSRELPYNAHRTMVLAKSAVATMAALLVRVYHMVMLKLGYEQKAHSSYCGSMNVAEYQTEDRHLHINGESICYYLMQAARSIGAAGWFVSRKVLSFLWLAIVSPGKAASGIFWWLGTGWYQLTTLVSLLNVFLLTRCLPKAFRLLLLLIPLLLLLGLWWWGFDTLLAMLPALSGFTLYSTQTEDPIPSLKPMSDIYVSSDHEKKELNLQFDDRMKALEKNFGLMTAHHDYHLEDYKKLKVLVVDIREQMGQMSDKGHTSSVIASLLDERFAKMKLDLHEKTTDENSINKNHEARILHLESLLTKLSEAIEEDRRRAQTNTSEGQIQDQSLLRRRIESLEREFAEYKGEFLKGQMAKSSCDLPDCVLQKVDARVRESVQMMFGSQADLPESLLQWLSTNYVSNVDLGTRLQKLELQILRSITHQISITKKVPTAKVVEGAVIGSVSGITEEDARVLVNNALKLYSQDRTGMVDFALESGGGSILGTRCSETYGTKTALLSLFGIPLWYLSQSPRVVIQPDMYPGNCWAFKGAQGFLVVRLSMAILPTAFSLEHISKSLSPTGNITSAPKDFAVYGLENEYQEDGTLLVQSIYDEEGEPLQTFYVMVENEKPFQIVELRILSNWGHADYTCLYRFRAHGTPMK
ncbi:SUN domain-containing protein 1 isoform X2 [Rana temporaria]|uniref:SUN domain-containing protein 1 isoform X2 n=1 Tax=Rana temporaria TaxID=8407 RepID=UPI001AAC86BF|nr:SUN domain-containing protein 1 isoform X2 [Rana temporaria]